MNTRLLTSGIQFQPAMKRERKRERERESRMKREERGQEEEKRREGGGLCSVYGVMCLSRFFLLLFEVCPSKREMRGSDLLFFFSGGAHSEEAFIHNYSPRGRD